MTDSANAPDRTFDRRSVLSWCLYDWANSPFPAIVLTFVFPAYFIQAVEQRMAAEWVDLELGDHVLSVVPQALGLQVHREPVAGPVPGVGY